MSVFDDEAAGRRKPDLKLSRRSLVAAGALFATLGPLAAKKASAQVVLPPNFPPDDLIYGRLCQLEGNPKNQPICMCFVAGTRLLTPVGEVAIEELKIGARHY